MIMRLLCLMTMLFSSISPLSNLYAVEKSAFPILVWWVPVAAYQHDVDNDGQPEAGGGNRILVCHFKGEIIVDNFIDLWHGRYYDYAAITMHLGLPTSPTDGVYEHPVPLCDTIARAGFDSFGGDCRWSNNWWENYWYFQKGYSYTQGNTTYHLETDQDDSGVSDIEEAYNDYFDQCAQFGLKMMVEIPCFFNDNRVPYDDTFPQYSQVYYNLPDPKIAPFNIPDRPYGYKPFIYFQDADDFSKNISGNPDNPTIHTPPSMDEWWYNDNQNRSWTCNWGGDVEYTIDVATEPDLWDGYALRYWTRMNEVWDSPECLGYRLVDEPFAWDFFDMACQMRLTHDMSLYADLELGPPIEFIPQTWKKPAMIILPTAPDGHGGEDWSDYPMTDLCVPEAGVMSMDDSTIENPYGYTGKDYYDWVVHCYLYPQTENLSKEYEE